MSKQKREEKDKLVINKSPFFFARKKTNFFILDVKYTEKN